LNLSEKESDGVSSQSSFSTLFTVLEPNDWVFVELKLPPKPLLELPNPPWPENEKPVDVSSSQSSAMIK
jgi:hypothetical protein